MTENTPPPLYNRAILALAVACGDFPRLDRADLSVDVRAPLCGSRITLDLMLDRDLAITALGMMVQACALGQASAALFARAAVGRPLAGLAATAAAIAHWLETAEAQPDGDEPWPGFALLAAARPYPARHGAILLPFRAAVQAGGAACSRSRKAAT